MDNRDFSGIGDRILDSVEKAIDSMDFNQLNKTISGTVNDALYEARNQVTKGVKYGKKAYDRSVENEKKEPGYRAFQTSKKERTSSASVSSVSSGEAVLVNQSSKIPGILYTVSGGAGLLLMFVLFLIFWLVAMLFKPAIWTLLGASLFMLIISAFFGVLLYKGVAIRGRLKRAKLYAQKAGKKMYCSIEELAGSIGKSRDYVIKDVQKMMEAGIFSQTYLDEQKTCVMFSKETYRQYVECQRGLKEREAQEASPSSEVKHMMAAGQEYLRILREANDAIPGEVISQKIYKLEDVIRRIFDSVSRHPEQMDEMERFMEYYLPTTVKLVNAYRDFDRAGAQGTNVISAKAEIEQTLDTINQAFERLLDDLYQDTAMDITTDASVLQTMLKKDGWMESDFSGGHKNE